MTHHVHLPPLRNRPEDIAPLVNHFVQKACQALDRDPPAVDDRIFKRLIDYPFPGNVRELEAMVFDGVSTCMGNTLGADKCFEHHMSSTFNESTPGQTGSDLLPPALPLVDFSTFSTLPTLKQSCDLLVNEALQRSKGNQAMAARMLGISRQALNRRIKER